MLKKELLELLKSVGDEQDIDGIPELANKFGGLEVFKQKINIDKDFKSFIDSLKDQHLSKGIETWKTNNLESLVSAKVKELYPEEDPKDLQLKQLQQEMERMKQEKITEQLRNKALKIATEKGLPANMVDFLIGTDEASTLKNLETFEQTFTSSLETKVKERIKDTSYTPPSGKDNVKNPWSKEHFNLTEQARIIKENPELANQLKSIKE